MKVYFWTVWVCFILRMCVVPFQDAGMPKACCIPSVWMWKRLGRCPRWSMRTLLWCSCRKTETWKAHWLKLQRKNLLFYFKRCPTPTYQALEKRPYITPVRRWEVRTNVCLMLLYCTGVPFFPHITRAFMNVVQELGSRFGSPPSSTFADTQCFQLSSFWHLIWTRNC